MRIRLLKEKQKELINRAKKNLTWKELSKLLGVSSTYLRTDIRNESILLSDYLYGKLCKITKSNFDRYIIQKLPDNWGKSKGGKNSIGSTIKLKVSGNKKSLAEFIGIVLGDGNINSYQRGSRIGVYQVKIAGDYIKDKNYHVNYIKPMTESLFNLIAREVLHPLKNERFLYFSSKELVEFLTYHGLYPGDKIKNKVTIPKWILNNKYLIKFCIRGLIDTDGSIFRMSNKDPHLLRINFTSFNRRLLVDVRDAFRNLGFSISEKRNGKAIYISKKEDVKRYIKEIGFSNPKHIERLEKFNSPVV